MQIGPEKVCLLWFRRIPNHGEDCWSDSCPENHHYLLSVLISKIKTNKSLNYTDTHNICAYKMYISPLKLSYRNE